MTVVRILWEDIDRVRLSAARTSEVSEGRRHAKHVDESRKAQVYRAQQGEILSRGRENSRTTVSELFVTECVIASLGGPTVIMAITLIGMSGAGKSAVARHLAQLRNAEVVDVLEKEEGEALEKMVERLGNDSFL